MTLNPLWNRFSVAPVGLLTVVGHRRALQGGLTRENAINLIAWLTIACQATPEEIANEIRDAHKPDPNQGSANVAKPAHVPGTDERKIPTTFRPVAPAALNGGPPTSRGLPVGTTFRKVGAGLPEGIIDGSAKNSGAVAGLAVTQAPAKAPTGPTVESLALAGGDNGPKDVAAFVGELDAEEKTEIDDIVKSVGLDAEVVNMLTPEVNIEKLQASWNGKRD
jgi:hypothetical protein